MPNKVEALRSLYGDSEERRSCASLDIARDHAFVSDLDHGNPYSPVFFCGEAPGAEEDKRGIPFVGQAGSLLGDNLRMIGLSRRDVWVGNVVRYRPTKNQGRSNRPPSREEIEACLPLLKREIEIVDPQVIVTLGLVPYTALTGKSARMSEISGKAQDYGGRVLYPMYHPAASIYAPQLAEKIREDFGRLRDILD